MGADAAAAAAAAFELTHAAKVLASCSSWPRDPGCTLAQVWNLQRQFVPPSGVGKQKQKQKQGCLESHPASE
jgi:hypothetical protein